MHRRALLASMATGAATLAGCVAGSTPGRTPDTPTDEPCTVQRVDPVDPDAPDVAPRPLPERPDELTAASVEAYVRAYEAAYRQHTILTTDTIAYGHAVHDGRVTETADGFRVRLQTNFYWNEATPEGVVHADSPIHVVVYEMTEDRLRRVDSTRYDATPSLADAATMECF